jgi:hypothetical protein
MTTRRSPLKMASTRPVLRPVPAALPRSAEAVLEAPARGAPPVSKQRHERVVYLDNLKL